MEFVAEDTTYDCRKGCTECCKVRLVIPVIEAMEIERNTGISANYFIDGTNGLGNLNIRKVNVEGEPVCVFLKKGKCEIEDYKPVTCKLYPLGMMIHYGKAHETGEIISEPVSVKRKYCSYGHGKEEEKTITADEIKRLAEKILKIKATTEKVLKEFGPEELFNHDKVMKAYDEITLEETVEIMRKKYGDYVEYNVSEQ